MAGDIVDYTVSLHGEDVHVVRAGAGPAVVLLHGVLGSRHDWRRLVELLARDFMVIAPDLLGHGDSTYRFADLSLGAHAGRLRDLLDRLGVKNATLVGHSLGGGVAMQYVWLFPERCQRLVLVSSGGLGRDLSLLLRAPTFPGAEWLLPLVSSKPLRGSGFMLARALRGLGIMSATDVEEVWRSYATLGDTEMRRAFVSTIRTVADPGGQTVSGLERMQSLRGIPILIVWGSRDRLIPVAHGVHAAANLPGARLEVFDGAGHFPHLEQPERFEALLRDFVVSTLPEIGWDEPAIASEPVGTAEPAGAPEPAAKAEPTASAEPTVGARLPDFAEPAEPAEHAGSAQPAEAAAVPPPPAGPPAPRRGPTSAADSLHARQHVSGRRFPVRRRQAQR
ncbi:MAG: alpha/beta fold hydrolase [Frankiaceae bacterium]